MKKIKIEPEIIIFSSFSPQNRIRYGLILPYPNFILKIIEYIKFNIKINDHSCFRPGRLHNPTAQTAQWAKIKKKLHNCKKGLINKNTPDPPNKNSGIRACILSRTCTDSLRALLTCMPIFLQSNAFSFYKDICHYSINKKILFYLKNIQDLSKVIKLF